MTKKTNLNRRAVQSFIDDLKPANVGRFYFAGHGVQYKNKGCLVSIGAPDSAL